MCPDHYILRSRHAGSARSASADTIIYHELKVDASGRIVPWYGKGASEAYDQCRAAGLELLEEHPELP